MTRFLFIAALLFSLPAFAQDSGEVKGLGARGRFTSEQAASVALAALPGTVIETNAFWEDDIYYHQYTIMRSDNGIYKVDVNANTGKVSRIMVESLGEGRDLPPGVITRDAAAKLAAAEIQEGTLGLGAVKTQNVEIGVYERKLVYYVTVMKSLRLYEVVVDAMNGRVIRKRKAD